MKLSESLLADNAALWARWTPHPFTAAVADATLPREVFLRWLAQDYLFVSEGLRFLGVLLSRAPASLFDALVDTLHAWKTELGLFRARAQDAGADLSVRPFVVTRAYLDFLLGVAHQAAFPTAWAVLFAVERSYHDAWRWARERAAPDNPYREWLDNWGSDEFGAFTVFLQDTLDGMAEDLSEAEREDMRGKFADTARYEWLFWEMAWHGERFDPELPQTGGTRP